MNIEKFDRIMKDPKLAERAGLFEILLNSIEGEEANREGLEQTPARMAKLYDEIMSGYNQKPVDILKDAMFTEEDADEIVLVKNIHCYSTCEHHLEPIIADVSVAYLPNNGKIVGLSKIVRVVEVVARRLQVQERMGRQIAEAIKEALSPLGVAVVIQARHLCMERRGVNKPGTITVTSKLTGVMKANPELKKEVMSMISFKTNL